MTAAHRVEPVAPPYPPEPQKVFESIMPPGVPPLDLFTTLARVPRVWDCFPDGVTVGVPGDAHIWRCTYIRKSPQAGFPAGDHVEEGERGWNPTCTSARS